MQLRLHSQGYRTLDELKVSGQLNRHQLIGLAHYDEFLERMPREEASEIEQTVQYQRIVIQLSQSKLITLIGSKNALMLHILHVR